MFNRMRRSSRPAPPASGGSGGVVGVFPDRRSAAPPAALPSSSSPSAVHVRQAQHQRQQQRPQHPRPQQAARPAANPGGSRRSTTSASGGGRNHAGRRRPAPSPSPSTTTTSATAPTTALTSLERRLDVLETDFHDSLNDSRGSIPSVGLKDDDDREEEEDGHDSYDNVLECFRRGGAGTSKADATPSSSSSSSSQPKSSRRQPQPQMRTTRTAVSMIEGIDSISTVSKVRTSALLDAYEISGEMSVGSDREREGMGAVAGLDEEEGEEGAAAGEEDGSIDDVRFADDESYEVQLKGGEDDDNGVDYIGGDAADPNHHDDGEEGGNSEIDDDNSDSDDVSDDPSWPPCRPVSVQKSRVSGTTWAPPRVPQREEETEQMDLLDDDEEEDSEDEREWRTDDRPSAPLPAPTAPLLRRYRSDGQEPGATVRPSQQPPPRAQRHHRRERSADLMTDDYRAVREQRQPQRSKQQQPAETTTAHRRSRSVDLDDIMRGDSDHDRRPLPAALGGFEGAAKAVSAAAATNGSRVGGRSTQPRPPNRRGSPIVEATSRQAAPPPAVRRSRSLDPDDAMELRRTNRQQQPVQQKQRVLPVGSLPMGWDGRRRTSGEGRRRRSADADTTQPRAPRREQPIGAASAASTNEKQVQEARRSRSLDLSPAEAMLEEDMLASPDFAVASALLAVGGLPPQKQPSRGAVRRPQQQQVHRRHHHGETSSSSVRGSASSISSSCGISLARSRKSAPGRTTVQGSSSVGGGVWKANFDPSSNEHRASASVTSSRTGAKSLPTNLSAKRGKNNGVVPSAAPNRNLFIDRDGFPCSGSGEAAPPPPTTTTTAPPPQAPQRGNADPPSAHHHHRHHHHGSPGSAMVHEDSFSTVEGDALSFRGERLLDTGSAEDHRLVLEDPFCLLSPDDSTCTTASSRNVSFRASLGPSLGKIEENHHSHHHRPQHQARDAGLGPEPLHNSQTFPAA